MCSHNARQPQQCPFRVLYSSLTTRADVETPAIAPCTVCPAGTGGALCKACPAGTYGLGGGGDCLPCPNGTTSGPGSKSADVCKEGVFVGAPYQYNLDCVAQRAVQKGRTHARTAAWWLSLCACCDVYSVHTHQLSHDYYTVCTTPAASHMLGMHIHEGSFFRVGRFTRVAG